MAFNEGEIETMSQLSTMEDQPEVPSQAPMMPGAGPPGAQSQGPGGPGPDTPQEQQAIKLLMQAGVIMRRAAEVEPSIRYIIDEALQNAYLKITKHYGMEQEGKLALQQAKLRSDRSRAVSLTGPPRQPPTSGV